MTTRVAADIDDRKVFHRLPAVETIYAIKYRKWNFFFFFVLYYVLFPVNKYVCMYVCIGSLVHNTLVHAKVIQPSASHWLIPSARLLVPLYCGTTDIPVLRFCSNVSQHAWDTTVQLNATTVINELAAGLLHVTVIVIYK